MRSGSRGSFRGSGEGGSTPPRNPNPPLVQRRARSFGARVPASFFRVRRILIRPPKFGALLHCVCVVAAAGLAHGRSFGTELEVRPGFSPWRPCTCYYKLHIISVAHSVRTIWKTTKMRNDDATGEMQ